MFIQTVNPNNKTSTKSTTFMNLSKKYPGLNSSITKPNALFKLLIKIKETVDWSN